VLPKSGGVEHPMILSKRITGQCPLVNHPENHLFIFSGN
jgi:hypothetical protein